MTDKLAPEQLAEWGALAKAATPGPFELTDVAVDSMFGGVPFHATIQPVSDDGAASICSGDFHTMAFFASARTAIPALIAEVRRLAEQSDKFLWKVRDTCARAEAAEAEIARLTAERDEIQTALVDARKIQRTTQADADLWKCSVEDGFHPPLLVQAHNLRKDAERDLAAAISQTATLTRERDALAEKREAYEAVRTKGTTMIADLTVSLTNARRARDAALAREGALRGALADTITKYGAPGGPWNVPSDQGGWLQKARAALATKGE